MMIPKVGDIFEAEVRDLASDGRGVVAHPSNRTFFVSGVWPGERGEFRINELKARIGFASLHKLISASSHRVQPLCAYHGHGPQSCGGCPWQYIDYEAQLQAKQGRVRSAITRLTDKSVVKPIIPSPDIWSYRNRAQLKTDGVSIGYLGFQSHTLVDVDVCPVLTDKNQRTLSDLRAMLPQGPWRSGKKNAMTTLHIDEDRDASSVSVNQRLDFRQGNSAQNERMRDWLATQLENIAKGAHVVELFCGSGNFTEVILAQNFATLLALEASQSAVDTLVRREHASSTLLQAKACDLFAERAFAPFKKELSQSQILILDPPREGLKYKEGLLPKKHQFSHIFYISCDLATLCRDLAYFLEQGFTVDEVQPLDLFPHTPHCELLVALKRG